MKIKRNEKSAPGADAEKKLKLFFTVSFLCWVFTFSYRKRAALFDDMIPCFEVHHLRALRFGFDTLWHDSGSKKRFVLMHVMCDVYLAFGGYQSLSVWETRDLWFEQGFRMSWMHISDQITKSFWWNEEILKKFKYPTVIFPLAFLTVFGDLKLFFNFKKYLPQNDDPF